MSDDLIDARAAVDWAVSQIPVLKQRIRKWIDTSPYAATISKEREIDAGTWRLSILNPIPRIINAEAGAIVNSIRSSLDLLANVLAARNGAQTSKDVSFPIFENADFYISNGSKKIRLLSAADANTIERLQPYHGEENGRLLSVLHKMDIARKHRRLLECKASIPGVMVSRYVHGSLATNMSCCDGYTLASSSNDPNYQVQVRIEVALSEAEVLEGRLVTEALHTLAGIACRVIDLFQTDNGTLVHIPADRLEIDP